MPYAIFTAALFVFWLLLSGHYNLLLLSLGLVSSVGVMLIVRRMDSIDREPNLMEVTFSGLRYGAWLIWAVVKSNIDVARRIWSPALPISPTWVRIDVGLESPRQVTLYANSITLTPGTLTTDVEDGHFLVHALSQEGIEDLRGGKMEQQVARSGVR